MTDRFCPTDSHDDVAGYADHMTFPGAVAHGIAAIGQGDYFGLVVLGTALKAQSTGRQQTTPPRPN